MYSWILLCTFTLLGTTARVESHKPCIIEYSGIITNAAIEPNPPTEGSLVRILAELLFTRDVEIVSIKGFVENENTGFRFPFLGLLCDLYPTFCPAYKGDIKKVDWSRYLGPIWKRNVSIRLEARLLDEYDEVIARIWIKNCTIVEM